MTSTRSGSSNQAQRLAAAASMPSLDMPALGKEAGEPTVSAPTTGPSTRKRVMPSPEAAIQPANKAIRAAPLPIASQSRLPYHQLASIDPSYPPLRSSVYTAVAQAGPQPVLPRMPGVRGGIAATARGATAASNAAKTEKGLRHFSARVCAKVEEKGCTSYNEVADELVTELGSELGFDSKNIRRRVYDALNVLMAIDVIEKDKKEIRWLGLSNETTNELSGVESELLASQKRLEEKQKVLKDLVQRKIALHGLINRNMRSENSINAQTLSSTSLMSDTNIDGSRADRLYLPFILINAPRDCRVHCEMLEDRTQYFFEFDMSFFINEDIELLRLMGLDNATPEELRSILTPEVHSYYQTRLKSSLPVSIPADTPSTSTPSAPAGMRPAGGSGLASRKSNAPHQTMSSPVRSMRGPTTSAGTSTLRNQISASSMASEQSGAGSSQVPQSPQPIGYTGIFRKSSRGSSASGTHLSTPKQSQRQMPSTQAPKPAAPPNFGLGDDLSRFGFSFSDTLGGLGDSSL